MASALLNRSAENGIGRSSGSKEIKEEVLMRKMAATGGWLLVRGFKLWRGQDAISTEILFTI